MPFKLEHITTQLRVKLGCLLVANAAGEYGLVTRLARHYGVSRQFLYELKERTEAAAEASLSPKPPGRRPSHDDLGVVRLDRLGVERQLEKEAYERLETLEKMEREAESQAYQLAHGKRPRSGRPLEVATEEHKLEEARKAAEEALMRYEDARATCSEWCATLWLR